MMELNMTEKQFRRLLDLVYIGNWVLNSTRGDDRIKEYDQVESLVFAHCLDHGMAPLTELYQGELIPSRAFADGGIHEAIMAYEDATFFEILAQELALRDMDDPPITPENYDEIMARMETYLGEFEQHGTDNITVVILFTFYRNILLITKPQAVFLHIRRALVQSPPGIALQIREEGVRAAIGGNSCHIDPIAQRQEHPIDALAANDPGVLIGSQQCLRRRVDDLGPFCREAPLPGQDNIAPVRQAPPTG